jgi:hypothetical protein
MTSHAPHPSANPAITWTSVQPGLWVGKVDGEFAGMIEATKPDGYVATTRLAKSLGTFPTVAAAKASFAD